MPSALNCATMSPPTASAGSLSARRARTSISSFPSHMAGVRRLRATPCCRLSHKGRCRLRSSVPTTSTAPSKRSEPPVPRCYRSRHRNPGERGTAPSAIRPATWSASRRLDRGRTVVKMSPEAIADLVQLRRARDHIDRNYAAPLDVPAMARAALMSPAHFSRKFRAAYGETPYAYLMTRRIERAKSLLRDGKSVTETCVAVGATSLGSFSSRFTEIVGESPSQYRARDHRNLEAFPSC